MLFSILSSLAQAIAPAIKGVCEAMANIASRFHRERIPLVNAVWPRLHRLLHRLDRLALRWETGTLPKPRAARPRAVAARRKPAPAGPKIPTKAGWLPHMFQSVNGSRFVGEYGPGIADFVHSDRVRALLADAPQAGRLLRPLCHLFRIVPPAHLQLPPRAPRAPRPRQPRPPRPAPHRSTSPEHLRLKVPGIDGRRVPDRPSQRPAK